MGFREINNKEVSNEASFGYNYLILLKIFLFTMISTIATINLITTEIKYIGDTPW